jgi:hypothetical protein
MAGDSGLRRVPPRNGWGMRGFQLAGASSLAPGPSPVRGRGERSLAKHQMPEDGGTDARAYRGRGGL